MVQKIWWSSILAGLALATSATHSQAAEPVDWEVVGLIREEGFRRSQVLSTLRHLTDEIGPRLTGSPQLKKANDWTRDQLEDWGLADAHLEPWGPFGRGWSFSRASAHMLEPHQAPLFGLPKAWTPGTDGPVHGTVVLATLEDEDDLEEWRGELQGKVVLLAEERPPGDADEVEFSRHDENALEELRRYPIPGDRPDFRARMMKARRFRKELNEFLVAEGVVAIFDISSRDAGIVRVGGAGSREPGESVGVPSLVLAAEHYNWLLRLTERGHAVRVEIDVTARFHDDDLMAYNTVAEIPGTDKREELVMVGAHLDSWHAATGANDNAAGSAVAMEAVRILQAIGVEPRRTIRIALWSGEEQGLIGSREYVFEHFARRPEPEVADEAALPRYLWPPTWPIVEQPGYSKFSAYYNLDNGSGRIRGVYNQSNAALVPIFRAWLEPFHDVGADTVTNRNTGGTDHLAFDAVGLPGFQFIQDRLDYGTRTHHTHLDHADHAREQDLQQAAVVMASFLYHTAMREEPMPRKAKPEAPAED